LGRGTSELSPGVAVADVVGPRVLGARVVSSRRTRPTIVVAFSEPLDPARATDPANFELRPAQPGRRRRLGIAAAAYDPTTNTVTLTPSRRVLPTRVRLVLDGDRPRAVTDLSGNPL